MASNTATKNFFYKVADQKATRDCQNRCKTSDMIGLQEAYKYSPRNGLRPKIFNAAHKHRTPWCQNHSSHESKLVKMGLFTALVVKKIVFATKIGQIWSKSVKIALPSKFDTAGIRYFCTLPNFCFQRGKLQTSKLLPINLSVFCQRIKLLTWSPKAKFKSPPVLLI